jgi:hypothetical protein
VVGVIQAGVSLIWRASILALTRVGGLCAGGLPLIADLSPFVDFVDIALGRKSRSVVYSGPVSIRTMTFEDQTALWRVVALSNLPPLWSETLSALRRGDKVKVGLYTNL